MMERKALVSRKKRLKSNLEDEEDPRVRAGACVCAVKGGSAGSCYTGRVQQISQKNVFSYVSVRCRNNRTSPFDPD